MISATALRHAEVTFPSDGGIRVHPAPDQLRFPPFPPGQGPNRFDDPAGQYSVRYLADSLRGCLIEVMARFVPVSAAEAALQSVEGLDDFAFVGRPEPTALQGLLDWLVKQQVGHLTLDNPPGRFIDAYNLELIDDLDRHPAVRAVLDDPTVQAGLAADQTAPDDLPTPPHLSSDLIRAAGEHGGRRVTQAVGHTLLTESDPAVDGLAYGSRHDPTERCWALRDHVEVSWLRVERLAPTNPDHRLAIGAAAAYLTITNLLPPAWLDTDATTASTPSDPPRSPSRHEPGDSSADDRTAGAQARPTAPRTSRARP